ncbi:MAG: 16S rRNA (guanine(966)-N(2))-methyltransferase RsmD [Clostridia bacterium]|nr:16S rRNA (guanine(966)-N(2))-methyltransferase RsmD [Clostridia bacterium]MBR2055340.1 16S rRNA (guanine(966)-N(2))-methyltransferase RsmD [Clostridia bacterium]MBR6752761.1 16S rRNA (guanine(966)-N(2))-methyltransferase RsmD [Clostridia bacterium]
MRIIAGEKKSRRIEAPEGTDTRPTADRIKEALFSILQRRLYDASVLDLYAGSGALSLEALSRGAASAQLVDKNFKACKVIRQNIQSLGYEEKAQLMNTEDAKAVEMMEGQGRTFDLIFLDPPYRMNMTDMMGRLEKKLLAEDGMIVCEHDRNTPPDTPPNLILQDRREYGNTGISFFVRQEE